MAEVQLDHIEVREVSLFSPGKLSGRSTLNAICGLLGCKFSEGQGKVLSAATFTADFLSLKFSSGPGLV
jgi:hypothetical protein